MGGRIGVGDVRWRLTGCLSGCLAGCLTGRQASFLRGSSTLLLPQASQDTTEILFGRGFEFRRFSAQLKGVKHAVDLSLRMEMRAGTVFAEMCQATQSTVLNASLFQRTVPDGVALFASYAFRH